MAGCGKESYELDGDCRLVMITTFLSLQPAGQPLSANCETGDHQNQGCDAAHKVKRQCREPRNLVNVDVTCPRQGQQKH